MISSVTLSMKTALPHEPDLSSSSFGLTSVNLSDLDRSMFNPYNITWSAYNDDVTVSAARLGTLESLTYSFPAMIVVAIVLIMVIIVTALGNLLVVLSLLRFKALRTVSNYLIGNLAISDLLLAITVLPLSSANECLGRWIFGQAVCNVWLIVDVLYCTASIWNICLIAFDRYTATLYPLWYRERRSAAMAGIYIALIWCIAAATCVPPLLGWNDLSQNYILNNQTLVAECILFQTRSYVLYSAGVSFYIPFLLTLFLYISIFIVLRKRLKKMKEKTAACRQALSSVATTTTTASTTWSSRMISRVSKSYLNNDTNQTEIAPVSEINAAYSRKLPELVGLSNGGKNLGVDGTGKCDGAQGEKKPGDKDESSSKSALLSDSDLESSDDDLDEVTFAVTELTTPNDQQRSPTVEVLSFRKSPNSFPWNSAEAGTKRTKRLKPQNSIRKHLTSLSVRIKQRSESAYALTRRPDLSPDVFLENKNNGEPTNANQQNNHDDNHQAGVGNPALTVSTDVINKPVTNPATVEPKSKRSGSKYRSSRKRTVKSVFGGSAKAAVLSKSERVVSSKRANRRSEKREMRATVRMAAIIGAFCGMWVGFFTIYVITSWCSSCYIPRWLDAFFFWLGYANSTINPILYTIFNDEFRKAFQKILGCYRRKGRSVRKR